MGTNNITKRSTLVALSFKLFGQKLLSTVFLFTAIVNWISVKPEMYTLFHNFGGR